MRESKYFKKYGFVNLILGKESRVYFLNVEDL